MGGYTVLQDDWGNFDLIAGFRYLGRMPTTNYNLALALMGRRGSGALFVPYYFDIGAGGSKPDMANCPAGPVCRSFQQSGSAVVQHLWVRGPMIMANFTLLRSRERI